MSVHPAAYLVAPADVEPLCLALVAVLAIYEPDTAEHEAVSRLLHQLEPDEGVNL